MWNALRGKYGLRHTWRIDGLRIVFQKVSKKRKIDKCAEIMPFGASMACAILGGWVV